MSEEILALLAKIDRRIDGLETALREIRADLAAQREEKRAAKRKYAGRRKKASYPSQNKPHRAPKFKKGRKYPQP